jgi:hypothetical protein
VGPTSKKRKPTPSKTFGPPRKLRPAPFALVRTKPTVSVIPAATSNVPNRGSAESNVAYLDHHFTVDILRQLRPGLPAAERIICKEVAEGPEAAFTVALRFYISRLYAALQISGGEPLRAGGVPLSPDLTQWPSITACQLIAGDIWSVSTDDKSVYLCVGPTGEVVHQVKPDASPRSDWEAYLAQPAPLLTLIKTKDQHEFPRGIFRGFRGSDEERGIAERAALWSCVMQR